jgi:long-chain acyl-CoA synthetase
VVVYSSRVWESLAAQVQARLRGSPRFKRMVTNRLLPAGYRMADAEYGQEKAGLSTRITALLAERLLFRPIRGSLGLPRARVCYSSGATLAEATLRFFHALNVPLKNVYGSTEAGAVTGAADRIQIPGTVGSVNPGVELVFSEGNEIAVRHEGAFLGYHNDPVATALVVRDGWVHTGDLGRLENDEQLIFVERAQDVLTLTPGVQVCPQDIESRLRCSPFIKDAWVTAGGGYDSLSAVIVVDAVSVGGWADERKVAYTTFRDLSQKPEVYELIGSEIASVNRDLPSGHRLKKYVNLHKEFDADESELTRNRKLRRGSLTRSYGDLLKALSEDRDSVELDAQITYQDGRTGHVKTTLKVATLEQER